MQITVNDNDNDNENDDYDIGESGRKAQAEHSALMDQFERKKLARTLAVPTQDSKVRRRLQVFGLPQTLFAEGPGERRERLREVMVSKLQAGTLEEYESDEDSDSDSESEGGYGAGHGENEEFFTYGEEGLLDSRQWVARWSLIRAAKRIAGQRAEMDVSLTSRKKMKKEWYTTLKVTYLLFRAVMLT
jgi:U4/U6 small nuclear ribonucleoprotein PRP4